jgi:hypothetical protein
MAGLPQGHDPGPATEPQQPRIRRDHPDEQEVANLSRRWYHPRPQRRRVVDFLGFNAMWWLTALLVILLLVEPWW